MTPTREQLAAELARTCDRCGHTDDNRICLRPRNHAPPHNYEPVTKVIPF